MAKVLVVEDDAIARRIIQGAVESLGHTGIQASTGARAMNALQDNEDVRLVVTDLMLPELTGQELVRMVRGNQRWKDLPIIMVSGVVPLSEIVGILEMGASRFLPKPIDIAELKRYIAHHLRGDEDEDRKRSGVS